MHTCSVFMLNYNGSLSKVNMHYRYSVKINVILWVTHQSGFIFYFTSQEENEAFLDKLFYFSVKTVSSILFFASTHAQPHTNTHTRLYMHTSIHAISRIFFRENDTTCLQINIIYLVTLLPLTLVFICIHICI